MMQHVCLFDVAPGRGYRVSPCYAVVKYRNTLPQPMEVAIGVLSKLSPHNSLVSVALFLMPMAWTAVSRYPVLWSPDLPRA